MGWVSSPPILCQFLPTLPKNAFLPVSPVHSWLHTLISSPVSSWSPGPLSASGISLEFSSSLVLVPPPSFMSLSSPTWTLISGLSSASFICTAAGCDLGTRSGHSSVPESFILKHLTRVCSLFVYQGRKLQQRGCISCPYKAYILGTVGKQVDKYTVYQVVVDSVRKTKLGARERKCVLWMLFSFSCDFQRQWDLVKELNCVNQADLRLESHLYPIIWCNMFIILSELVSLGTKLA